MIPTITAFCCVKDGAEFIEAWLENTNRSDKTIIQDGGSTDGTVELIADYIIKNPKRNLIIFRENELTEKFKWNEANVRNRFLKWFTTEWVLLQDVDELIEDEFWDWFQNTDHSGRLGYYIGHKNLWLSRDMFRIDYPWYPDLTLRLFRPKYSFGWVGAEHGSLWLDGKVMSPDIPETPVALRNVNDQKERIHFVHYHRAEPSYYDAVMEDKILHHSGEKKNLSTVGIKARLRKHPIGAGLIKRRFNGDA